MISTHGVNLPPQARQDQRHDSQVETYCIFLPTKSLALPLFFPSQRDQPTDITVP